MKSTPESDIVFEKVSAIINKTDISTCIVDRVFIFFEFKSIIIGNGTLPQFRPKIPRSQIPRALREGPIPNPNPNPN